MLLDRGIVVILVLVVSRAEFPERRTKGRGAYVVAGPGILRQGQPLM